eukprot:1384541-Pyramimonas_sp.AAC.1
MDTREQKKGRRRRRALSLCARSTAGPRHPRLDLFGEQTVTAVGGRERAGSQTTPPAAGRVGS